MNALAAYIIHPMVAGAVKPYVPNDVPLWYVALGFALLFRDLLRCSIDYLEEHQIFLKL